MKVIDVEIQNRGKSIQIKTDHQGDYRYIWLDADNLIDIADFSEHL